ncbi:MAG: acetyltransferase [Sulfuricaulis sp.]|uniref:acetyltransferase n=1 Tax=Sulfuricaulis sp. TaxID=2003553 RepID=UPI0025E3B0EA|nr:acetyltransferase [Sulfuricaulis sp.]MCR4346780.1 acetyltransferase [Sulfuricaulis sp.]
MALTNLFKKRIVIWGASGHAKVLHEFLGKLGYEIIAAFDNDTNAVSPIPNVPLYHGTDGFQRWKQQQSRPDKVRCLVAIGGWHGYTRLEIQRYLQSQGLIPAIAAHPASYVADTATCGPGSQILAGSVIGVDVQMGDACIVNTSASVDHECRLGDGVHLAPGATIAGCVHIGNFSFIGAGTVVLPRVRIGNHCIIGAGSTVTRDIPDGVVAYGNPAKVVRVNSEQHND